MRGAVFSHANFYLCVFHPFHPFHTWRFIGRASAKSRNGARNARRSSRSTTARTAAAMGWRWLERRHDLPELPNRCSGCSASPANHLRALLTCRWLRLSGKGGRRACPMDQQSPRINLQAASCYGLVQLLRLAGRAAGAVPGQACYQEAPGCYQGGQGLKSTPKSPAVTGKSPAGTKKLRPQYPKLTRSYPALAALVGAQQARHVLPA